ncbi:hypothetical protein CXX78_00415 [Candidatus Parvarchaeota archaeon]|jgi:ribosome biogenesis GTPase A|nr:MAG: hypothetical protein CXX78_02140 [Candidatus Parvarchaeota archaeon]PXY71555.1 MAG: hypothetical protein CXX78_00415 [Candidatus Parvarchaeota archaeon]
MGYWPIVEKVIAESDFVLVVLDARMPEISENKGVFKMLKKHRKESFRIFTKIDLASEEVINKLRKEHPKAFFVSGIKNLGISNLKRSLLIEAKRKKISYPLIGIVGYPNVGKSAIINALSKRQKAKISRVAGTTKGIQWIKAGSLKIMDSPGIVPIEDNELKLGILGAKNPEKLKNLEKVSIGIIKIFIKNNSEKLENFYGVKINGKDAYEIFQEIGKSRKFLIKGGEIDENRTSLQIIRDWQSGKLGL